MSRARYLHFQLTESCNLACPGCYLPERSGMGASAAEIEATIFKPQAEDGLRFVTLTGGEPLMHPEWKGICEAAVRHFESVQLVCNGMLLDLDTYRTLRDIGVHSIKVSIDGSTPKIHDMLRGRKGCFEQVTGNLRAIGSLSAEERGQIDVGCICTVNDRNVSMLRQTAALVDKLGLDSMLFQPFHPYGMLYPCTDAPIEKPQADEAFLAELDRQLNALCELRRERPGFLDNTLTMLGRFKEFYTAPNGPEQVCGADRFSFVNSIFEVRGCLFCEPLASLKEQTISSFRESDSWKEFDAFRKGCTRCLMGCQFADEGADLAEKGFVLLGEEQYEAAKEAFDASLAIEFSITAKQGAGSARVRLDEYEDAKTHLLDALEHRPRNFYILKDLGETCLRLGQHDEAERYLRAALAERDTERYTLSDLGEICLNQQRWDELEEFAAKLDTVEYGPVLAARLRGLAGLRQEQYEAALPHLKVAMDQWADPNDPWQPFNYGLACLNTQRFDEAERTIRIAADMDPFPFFRYRLAMALQGLGRIDDAIVECRRAIEIDSGPEQFHQLLSELTSS